MTARPHFLRGVGDTQRTLPAVYDSRRQALNMAAPVHTAEGGYRIDTRRVTSYEPPAEVDRCTTSCTGNCNQGRNCTCWPEGEPRYPRMSWRERLFLVAVLLVAVLASRHFPGAWF